jgi:hypothetical protein
MAASLALWLDGLPGLGTRSFDKLFVGLLGFVAIWSARQKEFHRTILLRWRRRRAEIARGRRGGFFNFFLVAQAEDAGVVHGECAR